MSNKIRTRAVNCGKNLIAIDAVTKNRSAWLSNLAKKNWLFKGIITSAKIKFSGGKAVAGGIFLAALFLLFCEAHRS